MIKIILDTDLGRDCDDAGALALLHTLAAEGKADILAVMLCTSAISSAVTAKMINEWYGKGDIPIGKYDKKAFLEEEICKTFTEPLMNKYLQNHSMPAFENPVRTYRQILSENDDVTIAVIGMVNNIADLLRSGADDISSLSGAELVKQKVKNMYVMGGNFVDSTYAEYNIVCDVESAKYVSENFPAPIIYCGFELGENIKSGTALLEADEENPVRFAYFRHCTRDRIPHFSWDPVTVYCAVEQDSPLYEKSCNMKITFNDEAKTVKGGEGKDCYLIAKASDNVIQSKIDGLIRG